MAAKITVVQTRSGNRSEKSQRATLAALGLGRIGKRKQHQETPSVLGMLIKVRHLVEIER